MTCYQKEVKTAVQKSSQNFREIIFFIVYTYKRASIRTLLTPSSITGALSLIWLFLCIYFNELLRFKGVETIYYFLLLNS